MEKEPLKDLGNFNRTNRLIELAKKVGHVLSGPHTLASHGDHIPVTPPEVRPNLWDSEGCYFDRESE